MKFKPHDYQLGMIDHLRTVSHGAIFAGMGLGKTVTTLKAYSEMILEGSMQGVLIVAPLRVCAVTWPDQIKKWSFCSHLRVANLRTEEGIKAWQDGTADVYLINFEQLASKTIRGKNYLGFLEKHVGRIMPVDTLLIDELSLLKANSKRTKAVCNARKYFKRVHGLTGTPSPNGLMDLFHQLKVLDGGERLGKFITHFRSRWFDSDYMGYNFTPKPFADQQINDAIADICLVRRSEDHLEIPDCDVVDIDVTMPSKVMKAYKQLKDDLIVEINDRRVDAQSAATLINKLQQITAGYVYDEDGETVPVHTEKLKALGKLIKKHSPVLILTKYRHEMDAVLAMYPDVERFDEARMDDWRAGQIGAWVANPASLSHGIDGIQDSCQVIVWMSLTYSLEQYLQTNARILRTGQKKQSTIYRMMAAQSVDWAIASALENKEQGQSALLEALSIMQRDG